jgi:hypothetical protein
VELYGGAGGSHRTGSDLSLAQRLTEQYARFFNHALPFDRGVVEQAWARCLRLTEIEECRSGRARAAALLGVQTARR